MASMRTQLAIFVQTPLTTIMMVQWILMMTTVTATQTVYPMMTTVMGKSMRTPMVGTRMAMGCQMAGSGPMAWIQLQILIKTVHMGIPIQTV